jgi:hydroxypyruvate isomerase
MTTRRDFLSALATAPLLTADGGATNVRLTPWVNSQEKPLPAPKYTLSPNLEILFPREMTWEERLEMMGKAGAKAYSFWAFANKDLNKLRAIQDRYGMRCASITGANKTGWKTGLTKTGEEKAFLDDFAEAVAAAKRVGAENLITFVGAVQNEIPWETQFAQIVAGLKKAGDIAGEAGVYLTLEPLNAVESPQMSLNTTERTYAVVEAVGHPHVRVDFDIYHRQLGEGNLINTLRTGLTKGYVRFVEVGDVPGRYEPGTGEINYTRLFALLREVGYSGFIGMEHRSSTNPVEVFTKVSRLAGL